MRYKRAVEKLRILAETCERVKTFWFDMEPFLKAVYAFGEVVDGADPLDAVQVALAINLSPEEVPWESSPEGTAWLANELRLSKGGFMYFWRSYLDPIWNHYIRGPVRIWSVDDGPDERALTALEARDLGSLQRLIPESADGRRQLREDLGAALAHLREVRDKYWDHDWRREHRGYGRYPPTWRPSGSARSRRRSISATASAVQSGRMSRPRRYGFCTTSWCPTCWPPSTAWRSLFRWRGSRSRSGTRSGLTSTWTPSARSPRWACGGALITTWSTSSTLSKLWAR